MAEFVRLPADGAGKRVRAQTITISATARYMEMNMPVDASGDVIRIEKPLPIRDYKTFDITWTPAFLSVNEVSGGTILTSAPCKMVRIQPAQGTSGGFFVGGGVSGAYPSSGKGIYFAHNASPMDFYVDNVGELRVYGMVSNFTRVNYIVYNQTV